jgi:predicted metal-binding membrane protein
MDLEQGGAAVNAETGAHNWRATLKQEPTFLAICALASLVSTAITIAICRSMSAGMPMPGGWIMSMAWMRMAGQTWPAAEATFIGMWVVMMMAMMLPSLVPMLLCYRYAIREQADRSLGRLTTTVAAGYFFVWAVAGMAAYPLGASLSTAEMRSLSFQRCVPFATGILLLLAGSFQLTPWKARRLLYCRHTPVYALASCNSAAAWKYGLRLGVECSLCCAGLMILLIVTDVMSLLNMALVTVAVTAERLADNPERTARVIGVVILAFGLLVVARAVR